MGEAAFIKATARCVIGAAALIAGPASAQDVLQKSDITFYVQSAGGRPHICGIEFHLLYLDRTYRQGGLAAINGTLAWTGGEGDANLGTIFKAIGMDFPRAAQSDFTTQVFPIAQAFVAADGTPHMVSRSIPCDDQPLGFCGFYWLPQSAYILKATLDGKLTIAFNRELGSLDVSLPLDPRQAEVADPAQYTAFSNCMNSVLARAKAKTTRP